MKQENKDIGGEKLIPDDNGVLAFNEEEKKSMETALLKVTECRIPQARRGSVNC